MGVKALAESIILQSLEDLASPHHRKESIRFFAGDGFRVSAKMAGLNCSERKKILALSGCLTAAGKRRITEHKFAAAGSH